MEQPESGNPDQLRVKGDHAKIYTDLANAFLGDGNVKQAFEYFNKALSFNPANAEALNNLGTIYLTLNNLVERVTLLLP